MRRSTANQANRPMSGKISSQRPDMRILPSYPPRTYVASADDLQGLGVRDVDELLEKVNNHLLSSKQRPVTVGDFPKNRNKFLRLVDRWHRIKGDQS